MSSLEDVVLQFLSNVDASSHQQLEVFKQSDQAWSGCLQLVRSLHKPCQSFGASTLLSKCRTDIASLSDTFYQELIALILESAEIVQVSSVENTLFAAAAASVARRVPDASGLGEHFKHGYVCALAPRSLCTYLPCLGDEYGARRDRMSAQQNNQLCDFAAAAILSLAYLGQK